MVVKRQRRRNPQAVDLPQNVQEYTHSVSGQFAIVNRTLTFQTGAAPHFIDLTETVNRLVCHTGIQSGTVHVFSKHTTAAIVVNEHEPLLLSDMRNLLARLIPSTLYYRHNDANIRTINVFPGVEDHNGHAHCQFLLLGGSCHFPLQDGSLDLGQWQRIFLVELDSPRTREVVVQISGVYAPAKNLTHIDASV